MSLSDLASIGSLVSAAAVLISLVYLGLQVSQAARNQRAAMVNGTSARTSDQLLRVIESHNADLWTRLITTSEPDYTAGEIVKLMNILTALVLGIEDSFLLARQNLIDKSMFETNLRLMDILFSLPVPRAMWPFIRDSFVPDFVSFFETRMNSTPLREQVDLPKELVASLAAVRRRA
jgi:hypothetical protein